MSTDLSRPDNSPIMRGTRARSVREALRYSRRALARKYPFLREGTLQNWEDARFGGLTENGARQLAKAYQSEGLDCREEWLFYGIAPSPFESSYMLGFKPNLLPTLESTTTQQLDYNALVTKEIDLFNQHHHNTVDAIVADDGMKPAFWVGDHVAGVRYFAEELRQVLDTICIVQTQLGEVFVRLLTAGSQPDRYTLRCLNPNPTTASAVINDARIFSAAPVLWMLRKKTFYQLAD